VSLCVIIFIILLFLIVIHSPSCCHNIYSSTPYLDYRWAILILRF